MTVPFHTVRGTIDLAALQPEDLTAFQIGDALSKINRFNGRTAQPWSVAAHSMMVAKLVSPELQAWALLHDAHEVFIGDITNPSVEYICQAGTRTAVTHAIHNAKGKLDRVIGAAWGCVPRPMNVDIRSADWLVLQAEMLAFFGTAPETKVTEEIAIIEREALIVKAFAYANRPWQAYRADWIDLALQFEKAGLFTPPRSPSSSMTLAE